MNRKIKVLAKPSGISLGEHTRHVTEEAFYILDRLPFLAEKYRRICSGGLQEELRLAARYHDWGKSDPRWQDACQKDYQNYLRWRESKGLSKSALTAEDYRRYESEMYSKGSMPGRNLFKAGFRHELGSLKIIERNQVKLSKEIRAAIAAHHGKLGFRYRKRWYQDGKKNREKVGPFAEFWESFERLSFQTKEKPFEELLTERFRYTALRSLLQLADTRASRKEGEGEDASYELAPYKLREKFPSLRPVQQAALDVADEAISILRAPTGSGKTYAALLWAERQVEQRRADRLVIAMPTRFTSNALSISAAEQLGETGLYHSSAWYNRYGELNDKEIIKYAREAHRMARFLASPVTVCTIDHLLISLTGTRESHHSTFYFLGNSAVVVDEADFYDPFIQANIVVLIEVLRKLEVPILVMSATVPDSARKLYQVESPIAVPTNLGTSTIKELRYIGDHKEQKEKVLEKMIVAGHGIVYANTVSRALMYYRWFEERLGKEGPPVILYHSRFTEPDKKRIEGKLIKQLGKKAWQNETSEPVRGIAIMTQIGEMSVNISAPLMLSDLCPWDRLAQRIGRLVRFDLRKEGICSVLIPMKNGELYPAPYGAYNRKKRTWEVSNSFSKTREELQDKYFSARPISSDDFVSFVNNLYPDAPSLSDHTEANQREYRRLLRDNWLILPDIYAEEEDGHVGSTWASRHMPPQQTIYTKCPHGFSNYADLQEFGLEYGVSIPTYLLEKELRRKEKSRIRKRTIELTKTEESIGVYYTLDYQEKLGLAFLYEDDFKSNVDNQFI